MLQRQSPDFSELITFWAIYIKQLSSQSAQPLSEGAFSSSEYFLYSWKCTTYICTLIIPRFYCIILIRLKWAKWKIYFGLFTVVRLYWLWNMRSSGNNTTPSPALPYKILVKLMSNLLMMLWTVRSRTDLPSLWKTITTEAWQLFYQFKTTNIIEISANYEVCLTLIGLVEHEFTQVHNWCLKQIS
jgi:hypothetical protein